MRTLSLIVLVVGLVMQVGCQTITHGTTQQIEIRTDPSGATVEIPGVGTRVTPAFVLLPRTQSTTITVSKPGYETQSIDLFAQLNPEKATPRTEFLSLVGSAIDTASGGAWELTPSKVRVALTKQGAKSDVAGANEVASAEVISASTSEQQGKSAVAATPPIVAQPGKAVVRAGVPGSVQMAEATLYNLQRLEHLFREKMITEQEYQTLRALIISTGPIATVPSGN